MEKSGEPLSASAIPTISSSFRQIPDLAPCFDGAVYEFAADGAGAVGMGVWWPGGPSLRAAAASIRDASRSEDRQHARKQAMAIAGAAGIQGCWRCYLRTIPMDSLAGVPKDMQRRRSERSPPIPGPASHPDLLSDVLAELRVEESILCIFDFGDPWGVEVDHMPLAISWTVVEGTVWMLSSGIEPIAFHAGDTFLLPRGVVGAPYVLASSPGVTPRSIQALYQEAELQGFAPGSSSGRRHHVRWGGPGAQTRVVSTAFGFRDRGLSPLIAALPELMFVRASEAGGEFIDVMLRLALDGEDEAQPGFAALVTQISQSLSVLVVRTYALSHDKDASGWLAGLGDPQISRALACIHREPDHVWTVAALARIAGLSRSIFAERFLARVGQTPKRYLRAWRMHLAREALADGNVGVTALAHKLGYQSEAAFRTAFRHATGEPPREFRHRAEAVSVPKVMEEMEQFFGIYARLGGLGAATRPRPAPDASKPDPQA